MPIHGTFASAILATCLAFGAASKVPGQETGQPAGGGTDLLRDPKFRDGFLIDAPKPGQHIVTERIQPSSASGKPSWHLCQWNSRFDLATAKPESLDERSTRYANEAKSVVLSSGDRYNDLVLSLDSRPEFGGTARKIKQPWPHLLIEQDDVPVRMFRDVSRIGFTIEARLLKNDRTEPAGYSRELHSAQFLLTFIVQNRNRKSPGFGDFIWFSMAMYDERTGFCDFHATMDTADPSAKMIYSPAIRMFSRETLHDGNWVTFSHPNLCPLFVEAIETARENGFLKDSPDAGDFAVSSVNIGWEVTGINDVSMRIRNLVIKVDTSRNESPVRKEKQ